MALWKKGDRVESQSDLSRGGGVVVEVKEVMKKDASLMKRLRRSKASPAEQVKVLWDDGIEGEYSASDLRQRRKSRGG